MAGNQGTKSRCGSVRGQAGSLAGGHRVADVGGLRDSDARSDRENERDDGVTTDHDGSVDDRADAPAQGATTTGDDGGPEIGSGSGPELEAQRSTDSGPRTSDLGRQRRTARQWSRPRRGRRRPAVDALAWDVADRDPRRCGRPRPLAHDVGVTVGSPRVRLRHA